MLRRILFTAIISGLLGGVVVSIVQHFTTTPIILQSETFEGGSEPGDKHSLIKKGVTLIPPARAHGPHNGGEKPEAKSWAPDDGLQRTMYTCLANLLTGVGFALILTACFALSGGSINGRRGLLWGLAGFFIISLAPALGLPPEVPGAMAAALGDRQFWWFLCVGLTAAGLWVMVFRIGVPWAVTGIVFLALPHLIGAPVPDRIGGPVPPELAAHFVSASLATAAVFWCATGWLAGKFWNHFAAEKTA